MSAAPLMFNVIENYDVHALAFKLRDLYVSKGFTVNVLNSFPGNCTLRFEKDTGGINTVLGNGKGITVSFTLQGNMLYINFTDPEWTSKIVAILLGWFLCLIPFITGIIGAVAQNNFPGEITQDIHGLLNTVGTVPPAQF